MPTRSSFVITIYAATLLVGLISVFHPAPKLLWNASASVPVGLYVVPRALPSRVGELVVIIPLAPLAQFFAARRYLPLGVPLLKHILAPRPHSLPRPTRHHVDGVAVGETLENDRVGRTLPDCHGCRALAPGKIFVVNTAS